jgi:DNA-binding PadR family transcriptional regulator
MTKRKVSNPLALAVLACLWEHPMHPYEIASTLRERGKDQSIKLNYGSLYTVVESLQQHGLIVAQETEREGRRPERTIYRLTDAGSMELIDWISELLSIPVKEYTHFEAGLSLAGVLSPEDMAALLTQRYNRLELEISQQRTILQLMRERGLSRLFVIESEYSVSMLEAELAWTRQLADEIKSGTLADLDQWTAMHRALEEAENQRRLEREKSEPVTPEIVRAEDEE